ncbi:MAG: hypothetical protein RJS98_10530, partial [Rhodospirillaceae bacterium]
KPEQVIVFSVKAWDVNCPQHITRRYSEPEVSALIEPLQARIAELEARLTESQGVERIPRPFR